LDLCGDRNYFNIRKKFIKRRVRMKKIKSFLVLGAVIVVLAGSIVANGMTLQYIGTGAGVTVWIEGFNAVGEKGTGDYGTNKSKVVTGCKVRLKEGSYDETANNYGDKGGGLRSFRK